MSTKKRTNASLPEGQSAQAYMHLRVRPEAKALWQAAADAEGISLSKFIKKAADERVVAQLGTVAEGNAKAV